MVDTERGPVHQVEIEVGDTIHTKCDCHGLCGVFTDREIHRINLLERLEGPVPAFIFGRDSFVPEREPLMIRDDKLWTPNGAVGIHRIEKGGAADKIELYSRFKADREWIKDAGFSDGRCKELVEVEGDNLELLRAVIGDTDSYSKTVAYAAKLAGVELDERQTFIFAKALACSVAQTAMAESSRAIERAFWPPDGLQRHRSRFALRRLGQTGPRLPL